MKFVVKNFIFVGSDEKLLTVNFCNVNFYYQVLQLTIDILLHFTDIYFVLEQQET